MDRSSKNDTVEKNSIKKAENPSDYQETVMLPRGGLEQVEESKPSDYQETVMIPRGGLEQTEAKPPDYQETVMIPKSSLEQTGKSKPPDYQETMIIPRSGLDQPDDVKPADYQETVMMPRGGLNETDAEKPSDYQETVILPRGHSLDADAFKTSNYQETVAISRNDASPQSYPSDYQQTVAISREGLEIMLDKNEGDPDYTATPLEKHFYFENIRKGLGQEKYRFEENLISGGMGTIFRVLDQNLQRNTAMKVILPKWKNDKDTLTSFLIESKITGLLEHPNIIPVHELGFLDECGIFFTMKLAHGEAFNDILQNIRKPDPIYIEKYNTYHLLSIFRKVCDAISFAHSKNIIHQDIKPHNIMVGQYGEVLLMDWGMARYMGQIEQEDDPAQRQIFKTILELSKGKDEMITGSPAYMSPEQVSGEPLDHRSDIFLLGATLYHIFTLEAPYVGQNMNEVLQKAKTRNLIPPQVRNPSQQIPEEICRIILKAMAEKREDRYARVDELSSDIDDLIAGKWSQQEKRVFQTGESLMSEGEAGDEAYLILNGKVQVVKQTDGKRIALGTIADGTIVGEMALITEEPRSATVEALEPTEVAILTKQLVSQNLKKLPPYMERIVSTLTDRLRSANANIHPHLTSDCTRVVLKQFRLLMNDKSNHQPESLEISLQEIIAEISEDLGIPKPRIETVLEKAIEQKLITRSHDRVRIPNIHEWVRFTNSLVI